MSLYLEAARAMLLFEAWSGGQGRAYDGPTAEKVVDAYVATLNLSRRESDPLSARLCAMAIEEAERLRGAPAPRKGRGRKYSCGHRARAA